MASKWAMGQRAIVSTRGGWQTAPAYWVPGKPRRGKGKRARGGSQRAAAALHKARA